MAALYDIHGNVHALDAVLDVLEGWKPDAIVVGGDVASGPFPVETIERLMHLGATARFVMGNADREVIEDFTGGRPSPRHPTDAARSWCAEQLAPEHVDFLRGFEPLVTLESEDRRFLFCHGSPGSDEDLITPATPKERIQPMLIGVPSDVTVVCGHTHMQFDRTVAGIRIINAGSVGMPYERAPGAYWAMLGESVDLERTTYDFTAAAAAIRASLWPAAREFADENLLVVPTPEEAIAVFEGKPSPRETYQKRSGA